MASKVAICNLAIDEAHGATITALTDGTTEANLCLRHFDELAQSIMFVHPFSSTIRRVELARDTATPEFGYSYQYSLPSDPKCLRVLGVNEEVPGNIVYEIEGRKLLTDEDTIKIKYIAYITDTESWDEALKTTVTAGLAARIAYALGNDQVLTDRLIARFESMMAKYTSADSQQGSIAELHSNDLIEIRK